ncbi:mitochondrial family glycoprotein [Trifolium pratense]|uniref:Mitochondrial family glycoprotein n=1 Tax=Trifolium pratense TaxID=57577 RepID=A0A2K3NKY8_TRIPR|nr:mitochondrial family glycoprotein [Trifolium pratense]
MAFSSILRNKSSTFLRAFASTAQLIRKTQPGHCAVLSSAINRYEDSFVPRFHFSSVAAVKNKPSSDDNLLRIIESEITCAQETDDYDAAEEVPSNFPFKIIDSPGQQTITLERTYEGEEIKVLVDMPDLVTGEEHDNEDNDNDNESERATQSSIPISVTVSKKDGPSLQFSCVAYPDEIVIDNLSVKNPDVSDDQIPYEPDFHYSGAIALLRSGAIAFIIFDTGRPQRQTILILLILSFADMEFGGEPTKDIP